MGLTQPRLGLWRLRRLVRHGRVLAKRARVAPSTHIPVLIGLSQIVRPERVLELGCGLYSTLAFLNRSAFPFVRQLRSYENDPLWADRIEELTREERRIELLRVTVSMAEAVTDLNVDGYDLIFIDDSKNRLERSATIQAIARKRIGAALVVVHDFEEPEYRAALRRLPNSYRFCALNPNTGVAWADLAMSRRRLRALDRAIRRNARVADTTDISAWLRILDPSIVSIR